MTGERRVSADMKKKLTMFFTSQYGEYRDAVLSGKRNAGLLELAMVKRQERDLATLQGWHFDMHRACAPLIWFAANLKFPSGEKKGQHLKLEPWQVWIVMVLFGWVDSGGNRRYHNAYVEIARKNGKSTWAAAVLCYLAFSLNEQNGTPCYIGATDLDQAGEVFERAAACLSILPVRV